jgi:hypothetical protein
MPAVRFGGIMVWKLFIIVWAYYISTSQSTGAMIQEDVMIGTLRTGTSPESWRLDRASALKFFEPG